MVCCMSRPYPVLYCSVLYCTALYCAVLYFILLYHTVMPFTTLFGPFLPSFWSVSYFGRYPNGSAGMVCGTSRPVTPATLSSYSAKGGAQYWSSVLWFMLFFFRLSCHVLHSQGMHYTVLSFLKHPGAHLLVVVEVEVQEWFAA
jgi:hypothetical protein